MGMKNDPEQIETERRVLELRLAGLTFDRIAKELGYASPSGAWYAMKRALTRTLQEPADELRRQEAERLDRMLSGLWAEATRGNTAAIQTALKVMERRARLLGLDAPAKTEQTVTVYDGGGEVERAIRELALELDAQAAKRGIAGDGEPHLVGEAGQA